jgi:hypothetical protein
MTDVAACDQRRPANAIRALPESGHPISLAPPGFERWIVPLSFRPTGKIAATFAIGLIAGLGIASWWTTVRSPSSLTAGLPPKWKAASSLFDARVRARFTSGTPSWTFINGLRKEGFEPTWFEVDGQYGAKRIEGSFPCKIVARVYWRVGKDNTVSAVRGLYREEGCL